MDLRKVRNNNDCLYEGQLDFRERKHVDFLKVWYKYDCL